VSSLVSPHFAYLYSLWLIIETTAAKQQIHVYPSTEQLRENATNFEPPKEA